MQQRMEGTIHLAENWGIRDIGLCISLGYYVVVLISLFSRQVCAHDVGKFFCYAACDLCRSFQQHPLLAVADDVSATPLSPLANSMVILRILRLSFVVEPSAYPGGLAALKANCT